MSPKSREKTESIARTFEKYQMKLALLQEWEKRADADPDYVGQLARDVRTYHNQLVYKGAVLPNKT